MRLRHCLTGLLALVLTAPVTADKNDVLGRWNLTTTGENPGRPYWLEVKEDGGKLAVLFLNRSGSPLKIDNARFEGDELVFDQQGRQNQPSPQFRAKAADGKMTATIKAGDRTITLTGVRPPTWPDVNANGAHSYGQPVELFNGSSLDTFEVQNPDRPMNWSIEDGAMTNADRANNLVSKEKFKDFKLQAEYKLAPGSNSGIYLRGRYELQLLDDHGKPTTKNSHMAIYGWTPASVNASKPADEWQTMEAVVVGNRVTVTLNGQKVHDNAVLEAITGGAIDNNELEPGPIMIQGDHGKVWFRRLTVTPITRAGR
jgi:hypothetical protein